MQRHYVFVSDRKVDDIVRDTDLPADVKKAAVKAGVKLGLEFGAEFGQERRRYESRQQAVELAELVLERSDSIVGPLDVDHVPQWCRYRMPMNRGWQTAGPNNIPGMWFSGLIDDIGIVLAGSAEHSMGPRASDEGDLWMSDLPDQLRILQAIEEHVLRLDVDADGLAAALGVARGEWGGVSQELEFTARIDKIYEAEDIAHIERDSGITSLLLGSPLYVAQVG